MHPEETSISQQAAFETALDVLIELIVRAQDAAEAEQAKPLPDDAELKRWSAETDRLVDLRRNLRPDKTEAVRNVLLVEAAVLRDGAD